MAFDSIDISQDILEEFAEAQELWGDQDTIEDMQLQVRHHRRKERDAEYQAEKRAKDRLLSPPVRLVKVCAGCQIEFPVRSGKGSHLRLYCSKCRKPMAKMKDRLLKARKRQTAKPADSSLQVAA